MSRMGELVAALFTALILGFGVGELFGPREAAAVVGGCPEQICYEDASGTYSCEPGVTETFCDWWGPQGYEVCTTVECEEICDPEEDCEEPE